MLAIVFVALLAVLVVGFLYEMEVSASLAENQGYDFQAFLAAKSAVANGISLLADDQMETQMNGEPEYDSTLDPAQWSMGLPFEPVNDAMMRTTISDEYGKINLNALLQPNANGGAPQRNETLIAALHAFFTLRSQTEKDPVDAIIDWLDYGDMDAEEPEGAENGYYMSLENPYACKNGPLDSIEELLLIKGITPALYFGDPEQKQLPLSEYLTVHGDPDGRVNVNTAPVEVIAAMLGAQGGNADMTEAQTIYDEARTQPFEDLSRLSGIMGPGAAGAAGQTTGTGTKPSTTKPPTGSGFGGGSFGGGSLGGGGLGGRGGSLMQKDAGAQEKQLGGFSGGRSGGLGARSPMTGGLSTLGGTTKPLTANQTADQLQLQRQQQMAQVGGVWRVNSNVFRIYGDGMLDDVLVRVEAYVWRTPLDLSELQNGPGGQPGVLPGSTTGTTKPGSATGTKPGATTGTGSFGGGRGLMGGSMMKAAAAGNSSTGSVTGGNNTGTGTGTAAPGGMGNGARQAMADAYGAPLVPAEPFRILDWKVIR